MEKNLKRTRWSVFCVLAAFTSVFWGPWLVAWYWNMHPSTWSFQTMNQGTLLNPPLSLEAAESSSLDGSWSVLYLQPTPTCGTDCHTALAQAQQVIQALGKDSSRVHLYALSELKLTQQSQQILELLSTKTRWAIVDPHLQVILYYPENFSQQSLLKDLKRLMYVSQLG